MIQLVFDTRWGDSLMIDDDGRSCYAYLSVNGKIVSDVWLYNISPPPPLPEWTLPDARNRMPFCNPVGYASSEVSPAISGREEVEVYWGELGGQLEAAIHIRGVYHALLREGEKPAYCRLAMRDGPVAKTLHLPIM